MKHALIFLAVLLMSPLAALHASDEAKPIAKPNSVIILSDDYGMFFTQAYAAAPICSPIVLAPTVSESAVEVPKKKLPCPGLVSSATPVPPPDSVAETES